ncbi:MAG: SH3 domain-containing protein [Butyrivibrio sp.]|nr:SH3 domain-containing protein [Butyrivibrio sp.]
MKKNSINRKNLILLSVFALITSCALLFATALDKTPKNTAAAELSSTAVLDAVTGTIDEAAASVSDDLDALVATTVNVQQDENSAELIRTAFTVTEYELPIIMYTRDTVNVRSGAGTDYDKLGKLSWGSETQVTGETDNGWYEVNFKDTTAFIKGEYMANELPGIPYLFVGDSRTVQLKMAVGTSDKAYIAQVGEGYSYFKNTAVPAISSYAGKGTTMIINFGVNDLGNASKYIKLVNNNIDTWTNAGITVYYAAVTPVGDCASVSNDQIESFNAKLKAELDPRVNWLDGYSYLSEAGFSTGDGLHYNKDTYKNLYSYYMSAINTEI